MTTTASAIICSLVAALLALVTILSIRSGRILWYPAQIQAGRVESPALFWVLVIVQLVGVVGLALLAFH